MNRTFRLGGTAPDRDARRPCVPLWREGDRVLVRFADAAGGEALVEDAWILPDAHGRRWDHQEIPDPSAVPRFHARRRPWPLEAFRVSRPDAPTSTVLVFAPTTQAARDLAHPLIGCGYKPGVLRVKRLSEDHPDWRKADPARLRDREPHVPLSLWEVGTNGRASAERTTRAMRVQSLGCGAHGAAGVVRPPHRDITIT